MALLPGVAEDAQAGLLQLFSFYVYAVGTIFTPPRALEALHRPTLLRRQQCDHQLRHQRCLRPSSAATTSRGGGQNRVGSGEESHHELDDVDHGGGESPAGSCKQEVDPLRDNYGSSKCEVFKNASINDNLSHAKQIEAEDHCCDNSIGCSGDELSNTMLPVDEQSWDCLRVFMASAAAEFSPPGKGLCTEGSGRVRQNGRHVVGGASRIRNGNNAPDIGFDDGLDGSSAFPSNSSLVRTSANSSDDPSLLVDPACASSGHVSSRNCLSVEELRPPLPLPICIEGAREETLHSLGERVVAAESLSFVFKVLLSAQPQIIALLSAANLIGRSPPTSPVRGESVPSLSGLLISPAQRLSETRRLRQEADFVGNGSLISHPESSSGPSASICDLLEHISTLLGQEKKSIDESGDAITQMDSAMQTKAPGAMSDAISDAVATVAAVARTEVRRASAHCEDFMALQALPTTVSYKYLQSVRGFVSFSLRSAAYIYTDAMRSFRCYCDTSSIGPQREGCSQKNA